MLANEPIFQTLYVLRSYAILILLRAHCLQKYCTLKLRSYACGVRTGMSSEIQYHV